MKSLKIGLLLASGAMLAAAYAEETRLEAETFVVNRDRLSADRLEPGKWNLWSKDTNAAAKWSGGLVLQSNPVTADRKVEEAAILQFKIPVEGSGPFDVRAKTGRALGISTDGGRSWRKVEDGNLATRLATTGGAIEFQIADLYTVSSGTPGSSYLDYFIVTPAVAPVPANADFEQGKPGNTPPGWAKIWKRDPESKAEAVLHADAASGKQSLRISTAMEKDWALANSTRFPVKAGDRCKLICKAKNLGGQTADISIQLVGTDAAGKTFRYEFGAVRLKPEKDWTDCSGEVIVPEGVTHGFIRFLGAGNSDVLVDAVSCEWLPPPEPKVYTKVEGFAKTRVTEKLDRALVVLPTAQGAYLSWRLLPEDGPDAAFDLFRVEGTKEFKLNSEPLRQTTDFLAPAAPEKTLFRVKKAGKAAVLGEAALEPVRGEGNPYRSYKLPDPAAAIGKVGIGDLDGDGRYDFVVRTPRANVDPWKSYWKKSDDTFQMIALDADGKALWNRDLGWAIERGIWYSPYVVHDLNGDGRAEVILKAGEGDPRDAEGKVASGPEYLEVWDGLTGKTIARAPWPSRDGFDKRGYAYNDFSRNQLAIAYLDGKTPCIIALRGTYGLMKAEAWQLNAGKLESLWKYSSEGLPRQWQGQGSHNTRTGDIDGDGRDEIVLGSAALDDDGSPLWTTGKGHPDFLYLTEITPGKLGVVTVLETAQRENGGVTVADAATGKILWQHQGPSAHVHFGFASDIDPRHPGLESSGTDTGGGHQVVGDNSWLYNAKGEMLIRGKDNPFLGKSPHFAYWDADLQREPLTPQPAKYRGGDAGGRIEGSLLTQADLYGDWREELVTAVPGELRVYSTVIPAMDRRNALVTDPIYRMGIVQVSQGYTYDPMTRNLLHGEAPNCNLTYLDKNGTLEALLSAPVQAGAAGTVRFSGDGLQFEPAEAAVKLGPGEQRPVTVKVINRGSTSPIRAVWTLDDGRVLKVETPLVNFKPKPVQVRGIVIEAENFTDQTGGEVMVRADKNGVSGKALSHWDKAGHALTWKFEVPKAGKYRIMLRYAADASARRTIAIDGKEWREAVLPATGGLGDSTVDWKEWLSGETLDFAAGPHELTLTNPAGQSANLDCISLLPQP